MGKILHTLPIFSCNSEINAHCLLECTAENGVCRDGSVYRNERALESRPAGILQSAQIQRVAIAKRISFTDLSQRYALISVTTGREPEADRLSEAPCGKRHN